MSIGPWQIVLIVILVLIFFGPSRLPGLGKSVGEAIRGFKKGLDSANEEDEELAQKKKTELLSGQVHREQTEQEKSEKKEQV